MLGLWYILKTLFGELILLQVSLVKIKAGLKGLNQLIWRVLLVIPQNSVVNDCSFFSLGLSSSAKGANWSQTEFNAAEVDDVELTVRDHLICNLNEETSHTFVCVIITSDGVDHLD